MPRTSKTSSAPATRAPRAKDSFNTLHMIGAAVITLLVSLLGTGVVQMVSLYVQMATLTQQVKTTSDTLSRHLDHSVDKDAYEKRDLSIQKQLNDKAAEKEVTELRDEIHLQMLDLKELVRTMQDTFIARRAARN